MTTTTTHLSPTRAQGVRETILSLCRYYGPAPKRTIEGRYIPSGPGLREAWWMLSDALGDGWAWLREECKGLPELLLELAWRSLVVVMSLLLVLMVARLIAILRGA